MDILLHIAFIFSFLFFYGKRIKKQSLAKFYYPSLFYKCLLGLALLALYVYYYQDKNLDTLYYFNATKDISYLFRERFQDFAKLILFNEISEKYIYSSLFTEDVRSSFFIRLIWPISHFSFHNKWILSIYLSLICFFSAWNLTQVVQKVSSYLTTPAFIAFIIWPSTSLWTSGIQKETLAISFIYINIALLIELVELNKKPSTLKIVISILSMFFLWKIKYYYCIVLLISTLLYLLIHYSRKRTLTQKLSLSLGGLVILLFCSQFIHPYFHPSWFIKSLYESNFRNTLNSLEGHYIHYSFEANWLSLIINSPKAIISGLFRPFIWEAKTLLQLFASIENTISFSLITYTIIQFTISRKQLSPRLINLFPLLIYCLIFAIIIPLAAPNFGTLMRYRSIYFPFIIWILLSFLNWNRSKANHTFS